VCEHVVPQLDKQLLGAVLLTQPRLDHGLGRRFEVADLPVLPLHHPDDALARRFAQPWYQTKTEPSFEDMITKPRKTLDRGQVYTRFPRSAKSWSITRRRPGLCRSRRVAAKHE
jgi:hypothetical protein